MKPVKKSNFYPVFFIFILLANYSVLILILMPSKYFKLTVSMATRFAILFGNNFLYYNFDVVFYSNFF
jgi:hypothetical protein